jgi:Spx/MgsR family transcriptional regulator
MAITLYGIANCDTVAKARRWLEERGVVYTFFDYKKQGPGSTKLFQWIGEVGLDKVLNRAGTTFKKLAPSDKADIDEEKAVAIMLASPSCIKRPILEKDGKLLAVGFKSAEWDGAF